MVSAVEGGDEGAGHRLLSWDDCFLSGAIGGNNMPDADRLPTVRRNTGRGGGEFVRRMGGWASQNGGNQAQVWGVRIDSAASPPSFRLSWAPQSVVKAET